MPSKAMLGVAWGIAAGVETGYSGLTTGPPRSVVAVGGELPIPSAVAAAASVMTVAAQSSFPRERATRADYPSLNPLRQSHIFQCGIFPR